MLPVLKNGRYIRDNNQYWYKDDLYHRVGGPAIIQYNGVKIWMYEGQPHRDNGPAEIHPTGVKVWYQHGLRHRTHGPALVFPTFVKWFINGEQIKSMRTFQRLTGISDEMAVMLKLKYGGIE